MDLTSLINIPKVSNLSQNGLLFHSFTFCKRKELCMASGYQEKKLSDGTYLVARNGDDIDKNHWHVAKDGTVLSIKSNGNHLYNRGDVRKSISAVTGLHLETGWR